MIETGLIAIIISMIALVYAGYLAFKILKIDPGTERMQEISKAIKEGAMAFMARQYRTIAYFAVVIAAILSLIASYK